MNLHVNCNGLDYSLDTIQGPPINLFEDSSHFEVRASYNNPSSTASTYIVSGSQSTTKVVSLQPS